MKKQQIPFLILAIINFIFGIILVYNRHLALGNTIWSVTIIICFVAYGKIKDKNTK